MLAHQLILQSSSGIDGYLYGRDAKRSLSFVLHRHQHHSACGARRKPTFVNKLNYIFKMVAKLYKLDGSPAARTALMGCELFNVPVEYVDVDLFTGGHLDPDFVKKTPIHRIPVLEDGDLILQNSNAILAYVAEAYGNKQQESFYPKDIKKRALVNQKLFFNDSILFPRFLNITAPLVNYGKKDMTEEKYQLIDEAYAFLEAFLSRTKYLALDNITIADIAAYATTTSISLALKIDEQKYPKTLAWTKVMEQQPYAQKFNAPGLILLRRLFESHDIKP